MTDAADRRSWVPPPSDEYQEENPDWSKEAECCDSSAASNTVIPGLRHFLSIESWSERELPKSDRLLGDLVTPTTRIFLVGRTGLGKTLLALALACGMASGEGFLHWHSDRAARVLVLDGEMPGELIRQRAIDALRRAGIKPKTGYLAIYARDMEEVFAAKYPILGRMEPLNTEAGRAWVIGLIEAIGGVDVVIFDNVMSLLAGDQKDEVAWSGALELVQALTARRIGQVWLDHTGHDSSRQYGSSTKAWRFDAVGILAPLSEQKVPNSATAFTLSFDHPGKARRRTPDNWRDFEACIIRLTDDQWTSNKGGGERKRGSVPPSRRVFHDAMLDAISSGATVGPGQVTRAVWEAECIRRNLIEARGTSTDTESARTRSFRRAIADLQAAGWIGANGDVSSDLTRSYVS